MELTDDDVINFLTDNNEKYQISMLEQFDSDEDKLNFLMPLYFYVQKHVPYSHKSDDEDLEGDLKYIQSKTDPDVTVELFYDNEYIELCTRKASHPYSGNVIFTYKNGTITFEASYNY